MMEDSRSRWTVGELPFIWKPLSSPHNPDPLPDSLPFTLAVDSNTGTLIQEASRLVSTALSHAYSSGSVITGQMDEDGIGRGYADDFWDFMGNDGSRFHGKRVLEVGCGNGYLLHRLAIQGADVLGIDPGDHSKGKYDVPIIRDFFPSKRISGLFDGIIAYAMLEHVEAPCEFLGQLLAMLKTGGELFIGVPDCGPYLDSGDISCLFHEHWSYFDSESLLSTVHHAGGTIDVMRVGQFGGLLYARVRKSEQNQAAHPQLVEPAQRLMAFRARAEQSTRAIVRYFMAANAGGESVGVYVPSRVVNVVSAAKIPTANCRFFDDNPMLKGTYFPGLPVPIEERHDLIARPTDRVLIMSRSFGKVIAKDLRKQLPSSVAIMGWDALFDTSSE